jgi:hypothetical protein
MDTNYCSVRYKSVLWIRIRYSVITDPDPILDPDPVFMKDLKKFQKRKKFITSSLTDKLVKEHKNDPVGSGSGTVVNWPPGSGSTERISEE